MTDEHPACPYCDTLSLNTRNPEGPGNQPDSKYYCRRCGRGVDNPNWRVRKRPRTRTPEGTVARELEDHDPGDLVADGGRAGYVAECDQCGIIEDGDLEDVGDAVEDHDQFHDVEITRVATDGGQNLSAPKAGYPYDALSELVDASEGRFLEHVDEHGKGDNWTGYAPTWFAWQAMRNLAAAFPSDDDVDLDQAGDALNYLLFAVDAARTDNAVTDGSGDGADEWCDWCQMEFQHGPTWKVEAATITGYFCSRACAEQWGNAATTPERIDQPDVATDGGQRTAAGGGGATHPGVDTAVAQTLLDILDEDNRLYYSAGNSTTGTDRSFHSSEDCRRLDRAKSTTSCNARRRPRGHLCSECFPEDVTVDDIDDAIEEVHA